MATLARGSVGVQSLLADFCAKENNVMARLISFPLQE